MRLINSRGRVLLEVTDCTAAGIDSHGLIGVLYSYTGDGCGGYTDLVNLNATINAIKADNPSAVLSGCLPNPSKIVGE